METGNPLIDDAFIEFLMDDVFDVGALCDLPGLNHHSRDTFEMFLDSIRRFARRDLFPVYKAMDEEPPVFRGGRIETHPALPGLWKKMVELGILGATRPEAAGGVELPLTVYTLASAYLMAANLSVYGYAGLTIGAAHLIEAFGSESVKEKFLSRMNEGEWTGTMALTEPQAGSSLADITTTATPTESEHYLVRGSKIFISGGDHRATDNVVHLTLARIEGAPAGSRGISLFAIPSRRLEDGALVANDVTVAGMIHKIGWKGLPSLALEFGDNSDCRGYLVGEPNRGLAHMFQMMNEARIMVGVNGAATASVAYHEARRYALERKQGRAPGDKAGEPVSIARHPDVRRMLLRQKAIVEGSLALLTATSRYADLAHYAESDDDKSRAKLLVDLLTPIAKTFPAEYGFESNALAVQVHGGYGYSSEYLVESFLRDQKLNSLHEGTSGIQSLDLLGRKAIAGGGAAIGALGSEIAATCDAARAAGLDAGWIKALEAARDSLVETTRSLGARGLSGDVESMLAHSADYLQLASIVVVAWQWLNMASAAARAHESQRNDRDRGTLACAQYWLRTEVPRVAALAELCTSCERSYLDLDPAWL